MQFYGQTLDQVMALPLKTFWFMNSTIDRIQAMTDMRQFQLTNMAQATMEQAKEYQERLVIEAGTVVKFESTNPLEAKRDEEGFAELKRMAT